VIDGLYQGQLTVFGRRSLKHGRVSLTLGVTDPGQIDIRQAAGRTMLIKAARERVIDDGKLSVALQPTAAALRRLRSHTRLTTRVKISYTPRGGVTSTTSTAVELTRS
jgi:hypothetical protein